MDRAVALTKNLVGVIYLWIGQLVLISKMDIVDRNLKVVDHLGDELVQEGCILFLLVYHDGKKGDAEEYRQSKSERQRRVKSSN